MIIDMHLSIPPDWQRPNMAPFWEKCTVQSVLERMDDNGIARGVLFSIAREPKDIPRINDHIRELVMENPERFIGFMNLYPPDREQTRQEIGRALDWGFRGLKIHPNVQNFPMNHPGVTEMLYMAKLHELPVIIHVDSPIPDQAANPGVAYPDGFPREYGKFMQAVVDKLSTNSKAEFLRELPHLDSGLIYAAHMGGAYYPHLQTTKLMFQTCGATKSMIEHAVQSVGSERIVYGSDFPFCEPKDEIQKIRDADIKEADKEKILGKNLEWLANL